VATSTKTIRVVVNPTGAQAGAAQVNQALGSIGNTSTGVSSRLSTNFGNVGRSINSMGTSLNAANSNTRVLGGSLGSLGSSAQAAMGQLSGLGGALGSIGFAGAALGVTAVVGGLSAFGAAAVSASAKMESFRASLTTVLGGDAQKAAEAMDALNKFAAQTPFSLDQSVEGFIKLKALGLQPSERAMMSYGNTASAMGKNLNQMVEAVADAATGEFERLKEFGIKSAKSGNDIAFTFQGVTTKIKNNSSDIQDYLMKIGEVNFGGAMARQMVTFNGAMSNLEDTWTQTMAKVGDAGLTQSMGKFVNLLTTGLSSATPVLVAVGNVLSGIVDGFSSIVVGVGSAFGAINSATPTGITMLEGLTFNLNLIGQGFSVLGTVVGAVFSGIGSVVSNASAYMSDVMGGALGVIGINFEAGGRSWSNSIIGVLRAVKSVASLLPQIFAIAINDTMRMFRDLGSAIAALLSGQWSKAAALASKTQFANTSKAVNAVGRVGVATYRDEKGADAAFNRMLGRDPKKNGRSLAELAGAAPKPTPTAGKDDKDKDAAAKAKRENDFWETLKGELETSKLFGIEAAKFTKERELHKVLERDITASEKTRVDTFVQSIANEKAITSIKQASFDLENKNTLLRARSLALTEDQAKIEDTLDAQRLTALNAGVNITTQDYQTWLAKYRTVLETNQALEKQASLIKSAMDTAKQYGGSFGTSFDIKSIQDQRDGFLKAYSAGALTDAWGKPMSDATRDAVVSGIEKALVEAKNKPFQMAIDFTTDAIKSDGSVSQRRTEAQKAHDLTLDSLRKARDAGVITADGFRVASYKAGRDLQARFAEIGTDFANKLNTVTSILSRIGDAIGGKVGAILNKTQEVGDAFNGFGSTKEDISASITSAFGKDSPMVKGIGNAVGGAVAGLEIGEQIAGLGKAIGLKMSATGSKVGGAIGGAAFGPIGSIVGSIAGGLIGGLFKKNPKGAAILTGGDDATITGNKGSVRTALTGSANSVQETLANIASALGGTVGAFRVSIGKYKDSFRVSSTGASNVDTKKSGKISGLIYEGKDEAAAIAAAIKDALRDGAIAGISDFAKKALNSLDADAAISLVDAFKSITDELDGMTDPLGAAVRGINTPLDQLIERMKAVGASTTDLSKIEDYRTKKLAESLKSQLSSLNDFMDSLKGEGSGITDLARLNTGLEKFTSMQGRIAAGDTSIDQGEFTKLGQEIFSLAGSLYGTSTSMFQDVRSMLITATEGFSTNLTNSFNAAAGTDMNASTVTAINSTAAASQMQNDAMIANQAVANDLARQNLEVNKALLAAINNGGYQTAVGYNGKSGYNLV
jgi:hypothetical protein